MMKRIEGRIKQLALKQNQENYMKALQLAIIVVVYVFDLIIRHW